MNCKNLKFKLNKTLYCTKKNKQINIKNCSNCKYKEFKKVEIRNIKKRTYKQSKKERSRFSIVYNDLAKCCVPGCLTSYYQVEKNEVFEGAFRNRSINYGAVCPFCKNHHKFFHENTLFNLEYKILFQQKLVEKYSLEWFIKMFGQDYTIKYNKIVLNKKSSNYIK